MSSVSTNPPILVTGAHRGGTTWLGRVLAAPSEVGYIHEPFNPRQRPGIAAIPRQYWFPYVDTLNAPEYEPALRAMLAFEYDSRAELASIRSIRDIARAARDARYFARVRRQGARPLVKDPIAAFSSAWLASTFGMKVVVVIRHPAAFAASIQRQNWRFPFCDILAQPRLARRCLPEFSNDLRRHVYRRRGILEEAGFVWRMIYATLARYAENSDDWSIVRHEDLVTTPVQTFRAVCKHVGVNFSAEVEGALRSYAAVTADQKLPREWRFRPRDGVEAAWAWQRTLGQAQVARLRNEVESVSYKFYGDEAWHVRRG